MLVRNATGTVQIDSLSGIRLPVMPLDEWVELPHEIAMRLWRARIIEVKHPENMGDALWQEKDGTHIFWMSPFSLADGYATAAENMVLALDKIGVHVHVATCWFASRYGLQRRTIDLLDRPHPGPMKVGICMATAGEFRKLPTPFKIGWTMYEADNPLENLPEWRHDCNVVDLLLVPSEYTRDVFAEFVHAPIEVTPLAVSPFYCTSKRKRITARPFTFGVHGTLTDRKSPIELMDAFQKAFPNEQDVRLQLKTRLGILGYGQKWMPPITDHRIHVINNDWMPERLRGWLEKIVDVYVFPSKGEGFGMPPREALATGCPTIIPAHTGMLDIATDRYVWSVPVKEKVNSPLGGQWRIPDWDYLIDVMRWMYHNRQQTYDRGFESSKRFVAEHGSEAAARKLMAIVNAVDPSIGGRSAIIQAETLADNPEQGHQTWFAELRKAVPSGHVIDVGVGEGVLYRWLVQNGYKVTGLVEPSKVEATTAKLKAAGLPVNIRSAKLWDWSKLGLRADACVSQSVLQEYRGHETELILREAVKCAPVVMFSVPTVHYPAPFSVTSHMRRRDHWEDLLLDFTAEVHYYGQNRKYIWVRIHGFEPGSRAETEKQDRYRGRVMDGVWKPLPTPVEKGSHLGTLKERDDQPAPAG